MGEFFKKMRTEVNSRIRPLIRFNRRERLRKKFALYLLLVLLTTIVFEEGEKIVEICSASSTVTISNASVVKIPEEKVAHDPVTLGSAPKAQADDGGASASLAPDVKTLVAQTFGDQADNALKVMQCESQGDASRIGDKQLPKPSYGLFQISRYFHPQYDADKLLDAKYNIEIAKVIYDKAGSWKPWTCGRRIIYNESI